MNYDELKGWVSRHYWKAEQVADWCKRYFYERTKFLAARTGTESANLPVKTGDDGYIDSTFLGSTGIAELIADTVGAMVSGNTETGISVTYQDGDNTLDFDAQTAGDARYLMLTTDQTAAGHKIFSDSATSPIVRASAASNPSVRIESTGINLSANQQTAFGVGADEAAVISVANNSTGGSWWKSASDGAASSIGSYWTHYGENDLTAFASFEFVAAKHNGSGALTTHGSTARIWALYNHTTLLALMLGSGVLIVGSITSAGANRLAVQAGTSTNDAAVGGVLSSTSTNTGNVGTGEDDIGVYSVPANTLAVNNQGLRFEAWGSYANNANAKTLRVRFGSSGTSLIASCSLSTSVAGNWHIKGTILRNGATTQKGIARIFESNSSPDIVGIENALNQTLSGAVSLRITGEATSNNDIVCAAFYVEWLDANT